MKAAGYIRVSTTEQADEGLSLDEQEQLIREYAERRGWDLVAIYADRGLTGDRPFPERPGAAQALAAAAELDRLIIWAYDRFGRRAIDMLVTTAAFHERDCRVASITEASIEEVGPDADLMRGMKALFAERERARIVERCQMTAKAIARAGRYNGPPVFGYRFVEGLLERDPERAPIVVRLFGECAGGQTIRQITLGLEQDGIPTVRGRHWRPATVRAMLFNPVYVGKIRLGSDIRDGLHEPIVDRDLFDRVGQLLTATSKSRGKGRGRPPAGRHLFVRGLLRCGQCGEAMVPRTNGGYEDYLCNSRLQLGAAACSMGTVRRAWIDSAAYAYFEQVGLDVDATRAALATSRDRQLAQVEALLTTANRDAARASERLARVRRDYQDGHLTVADWNDQRDQLEAELAAATAQADRMAEQREEILTWSKLADAEEEVLEHLAAIRAHVAGEVTATDQLPAIRAALTRLFDRFIIHRADSPDLPPLPAELALAGPYVVEPVVSEDVVSSWADEIPDLAREGLDLRETMAVGARLSVICSEPFAVGV